MKVNKRQWFLPCHRIICSYQSCLCKQEYSFGARLILVSIGLQLPFYLLTSSFVNLVRTTVFHLGGIASGTMESVRSWKFQWGIPKLDCHSLFSRWGGRFSCLPFIDNMVLHYRKLNKFKVLMSAISYCN